MVLRSENGLKKFKLETRYPHNRSEGTALRRTNGGTKILILDRLRLSGSETSGSEVANRERDEADEDSQPTPGT